MRSSLTLLQDPSMGVQTLGPSSVAAQAVPSRTGHRACASTMLYASAQASGPLESLRHVRRASDRSTSIASYGATIPFSVSGRQGVSTSEKWHTGEGDIHSHSGHHKRCLVRQCRPRRPGNPATRPVAGCHADRLPGPVATPLPCHSGVHQLHPSAPGCACMVRMSPIELALGGLL